MAAARAGKAGAGLCVTFLAAGGLSAAAYIAAPDQSTEELWWQVSTFGSAGAVLLGMRLHRPANPWPWWLVFASLATFAVMGLLGASFWDWPDGHVVWPLRDLGLVVGFVTLGLATLALARARAPNGDPDGAIDALVVMVAMAAVLWDTVFGPLALRDEATMASQVRFVLFPLLQSGVTAAALRLLFLGTVRLLSAWMLFFAATVTCAANVIWVLRGGGQPALVVDLLWMVSFLLGGAAALHPSMRELVTSAPPHAARLPFGRLVVLGIALISLPATVVLDDLAASDAPPVSAAAAVLTAGLVLWRLGRLVHERERASAALERRAAREVALARVSGRALAELDADAFLAEAALVVQETLRDCTCSVVPTVATVPASSSAPARITVPLAGSGAALVVEHPRQRRLDPGEQEFLQAVCNVLVGALRRWSIEKEIRHRSLHDALTDLPNRILLLDRLEQVLARSRRTGRPVSVLFVDLDGFKHVNDSLGHKAGDELLAGVAARLSLLSRPHDTLARLAGDEFVVVCDETDHLGAKAVAERVVHELSRPFNLRAGTALVGASVGVASSGGRDRSAEQLLQDADAAMYRAKQGGRGRVEVFDEQLRQRLSRLDQVEHDLRGAHERGELRLVYQPVVALGEGRVVGAEALVRWIHPREGLVLPKDFIHVAETRGLVVPLGGWVIAEACRQVARWRADKLGGEPLTVAVNVSARQLADPAFVRRFARLLDDTGAKAEDVVLELTETAITDDGHDSARLAHTLHELRALGARIALDDFGTGYSSLTHLRTLPLDILKVDGSFVGSLGLGGREHAIVSALAGLAQELGVTVLAEGVETAEQLIAVRALQFDLAQGFHLGRPGSAHDLERLVAVPPHGLK